MDANTTNANNYSTLALAFIDRVRQHNPLAAACLEQLLTAYGSRTAYLAAFALVHLKNQQLEKHYGPSKYELHAFTFCEEMRDTRAAMRLYEQAAAHLFPDER